nr:MAG TPA: hypothetical protein [Caudoviricetes sp.]DAW98178.1 MAG TPA: hypothetical protein [Bacteriophage sp.]
MKSVRTRQMEKVCSLMHSKGIRHDLLLFRKVERYYYT